MEDVKLKDVGEESGVGGEICGETVVVIWYADVDEVEVQVGEDEMNVEPVKAWKELPGW